jgi:hypothetical protein
LSGRTAKWLVRSIETPPTQSGYAADVFLGGMAVDINKFIDDNPGDGTYDKGRHAGLRGTRIAMTRVVAFALV